MSKRKRAEKYIGKNIKYHNFSYMVEDVAIAIHLQNSTWSQKDINCCGIKKSLCFKLKDNINNYTLYIKVNSRVRYEVV